MIPPLADDNQSEDTVDKQKVSFQISKAILWKFNEEVR